MKAKWLGLCLGLLMSGMAVSSTINKVVVFGDSLSDTGNLYEYMHHQLPMSPPYYEGRFSNGPVWIEHLIAHYFPEDAKKHLIDYAFGGAGVGSEDENDDDDISNGALLNLDNEISSYLLAHDDKADVSSLYVVWMGSNNYLSLPEDLDGEVQFTLTGIRRGLESLVKKSAQNIMVVGVPDLGEIPMAHEFEYTKELSYLSSQHNIKLEEEVTQLQALYPDVHWIFYHVDVLLSSALERPAFYGFKNTSGTCYGTQDYLPSSHSVLNMVSRVQSKADDGKVTDICDAYLFFDPVHPSGRAHQYISEWGIKALDEAGFKFG